MKLGYSQEDQQFRAEIAGWLKEHLAGPGKRFREVGDSYSAAFGPRKEWERELGHAGLSCIAWPKAYGGRDATLMQQAIFIEEYVKSRAPARVNFIGVEFIGPTLLAHGREDQKQRFLPKIASGEEIWAQGFSEPNAGSDLSNVQTRARLEEGAAGAEWVIDGQKIWTSFAQHADWIFLLCRTEPGSKGSKGLSYVLVPMRQKGVTVRPIRQITGESDFNEVFFDGARTSAANVVGAEGEGWKVAMSTLMFERGISTFGAQKVYERQFGEVLSLAVENGCAASPLLRQRLMDVQIGLSVMKANSLRILSNVMRGSPGGELAINKLFYTSLHQKMMELALDVAGPEADYSDDPARPYHVMMEHYLNSRADSIYAGTNQVQRNIIAERVLGLPKEPKVAPTAPAGKSA